MLAVFLAQLVDAFVETLKRFALVAVQQRLLPTRTLQRAGADAQQAHGAAFADVLAQQIADGGENIFVEASGRRQGA